MSDSVLCEKMIEQYQNNILNQEIPNKIIIENSQIASECFRQNFNECLHESTINEKGVDICVECGEEVNAHLEHEKEWKYYGQNDSKHCSDPTRVQARKIEEKSIYPDVENLGFSESIVSKANKIYSQVTEGNIYRGNHRRAIVFACIFHAYKMSGKPQSHDRLIKIFNLSTKAGLKGLKHVNIHAPKDSKIRTTYITPVNLVEEIMEQFGATKEQLNEIIEIYNKIKDKSSKLNRSRPKSIASSIAYYWICLKKKNISLKEFAKKVTLSELTINKIVKEIAEILNREENNTEER